MRRVFVFISLVIFCNLAFAQVNVIPLNKNRKELKSISKNDKGFRLSYTQEKLLNKTKVGKDGNSYTEIWLDGSYSEGEIGAPQLPAFKKLIRIPRGSTPVVKVLSFTEQKINLKDKGIAFPLYPNQPSIRKDQDSSQIKFELKKSAYAINRFSDSPIATIEVLGNLRSATIARVIVNPVDYNPGNGLIKVYNDIDIDVSFDNTTDTKSEEEFEAKTYSPYFDFIYKSLGVSLNDSYTNHPDLTKYPVKMLIVSNRMFEQTLQPFIQWKKLTGFDVKTVYTDVIGTTSTEIKNYIKQEYNSATPESPAPTFLVLVGDVDQVAASASGSSTGRLTDLYYASIDGDMFPDMYYGRLSATTTGQLSNIINKILYYEKYQFEDPSYLNNVTLIAGADGEWNPKVGQPTIKYGTANYFNQSKGFSAINEYGVTTDPNNPNASSSYTGCYITDKISVGLVNYTAHCSETTWNDPSLGVSSISGLSNLNKYPLAIGNCCLSGDFGTPECIGEAWIRAQNKGAVTYIGSSPSTYWYEDFYWAVGAFPMVGDNDGYVPTFQETTTGMYDAPFVSKYVTTGGMVFAGNLAVTEVNVRGYASQSSPTYYWQAYNILGDPSLMPYFTEAESNQVYHNPTITTGETSISLNALAYSYVAISKDGQLLGTSYLTHTGEVSIPISQITSTGNVVIVVTRPQTIPYIDTISAISPTGPYLILDSYTVDDHLSNNNGKVDYNESFSINIKLKNIGILDATNVKVKILGTDSNLLIQGDDSISVSNIPHDNDINFININDSFSFKAQENVPDQHIANFILKFYSDQGNWSSNLRITANAPVLTLGNIKIDDSLDGGNKDSLLNPGETCKAFVRIMNEGHASANDISFQISIPDSLKGKISINNIQTEPFSLVENSFSTLPFRISANPTIYQELSIPVSFQASVLEPTGQSSVFERNINITSNNNINISNDTLETCFSYFYDSGGKNSNYNSSENYTTTLVAQNESNWLKVNFTEFSTESGYDFLYIYDGPSINSPQIKGSPFSGINLPGEIISSSRCLTFRFHSDGDKEYKGWVATVECVEPQIPSCATLPIPSNGATAVQSGTLSWASQKFASFYDVYIGTSSTDLALVERVYKPTFTFNPEKSQTYYWKVVPGNFLGINVSCLNTWSFTTDTVLSVNMYTNTIIADTLLFYDSGGPSQTYKNDESYTITFKPKYQGNNINVQFLSFSTEASYDKLTIFNGLNINSPSMGVYSGTTSPGTVVASNSDGALTFLFNSDYSNVSTGWKAIVKSVGATTFKTISFKVQYNSTPISNASLNIGGEIKTTDVNGNVSYTVAAGNISVTVDALGYKQLNRIVSESETNSTIIVDLEKLIKLNIHAIDTKTLSNIYGAKVSVTSDSSYTNSLGLVSLYVTPGTYTLSLNLNGYLPYSQQLLVEENDLNLDVTLTPIKYQVSIIATDIFGNKIEDAIVSINDTTLTTNFEGQASGFFYTGSYPFTVSKSQFVPLSSWVLVNDTITKKVTLDAVSSLYDIEFTFIGSGPKSTFLLTNNTVDLYSSNILYSRFITDNFGKGGIQLPKGNFSYTLNREGYYPIANKAFIVDELTSNIKDTLFQKTFNVQFNVSSQSSSIQDATVTINGYSPENTNSSGQVLFMEIGYEKNLKYTVQKNGFLDAIGYIDVINPLVLNIDLLSTGDPVIRQNHIKIFPNPTSDQLSIVTDRQITRVVVINTLGRVVLDNGYSFLNNASISMSNLTPGVYILIVYCENSIPEKAMVIKK